jgi:hypothetical protein
MPAKLGIDQKSDSGDDQAADQNSRYFEALGGLVAAGKRASVTFEDKYDASAQTRCGTADGRIRA